jgi:putative protein kinase ArgK-like GTPase of G3E family
VVVLLLQPETGDDLQWEKAGLLEVADIVVIHKTDLPGAERAESQVRAALGMTAGPAVPVLRVSAKTNEGMEQLWAAIAAGPLRRGGSVSDADLLRAAQEVLARRFARATAGSGPEFQQFLARWRQGLLTQDQAAEALLYLLAPKSPTPPAA